MNNSKIVSELEKVVGEKYVSAQPEIQFLYHYDFITAEPEGKCDIAIIPNSAEEVQEIVKIANQYKIPIVPYVSGLNFGATATPRKGGIVVDLRRLNRVLEVNEDDMYAVVEGGITWADLKGYLATHNHGLKAGITFSPPGTGVVASCLCYGMFNLGMIGGTGAEFLNGMEVVLGSGDLVKVGSCSLSNYWYGRQPLPDLAGLFIGWEGSTGIVTKAAIKLWPILPFNTMMIANSDTADKMIPVLLKLSKAGLGITDLVVNSYGWFQSGQGTHENNAIDALGTDMPECVSMISTQAYTEKQKEAQNDAIATICEEGGLKIFARVEQDVLNNMLPQQAWGCWNYSRGGGGQWIGSYCSTRHILDYYHIARKVAVKHGKIPQFYSRILFGGHYCVARTNLNFNKNDPEDIENARKILKEIHEEVSEIDGVVMYKAPPWAAKHNREKTLPATRELIKKIKNVLDPNGIMNPRPEMED